MNTEQYAYGQIINIDGSVLHEARIDNKTGRPQVVLWKAGDEGLTEDFWHDVEAPRELRFKVNKDG